MDLVVIYDSDKEMAVAIDTDTRLGFGPGAIGPRSGEMLEAFYASVPYDLSDVSEYTLRAWWETFTASFPSATSAQESAADPSPMVATESDADTMANSLAAHEAANATTVPSEQPADTDSETQADQVTETAQCWNCSGTGNVTASDGATPMVCGICGGKGFVDQAVTT
jgi:hypothetical protein